MHDDFVLVLIAEAARLVERKSIKLVFKHNCVNNSLTTASASSNFGG
jgi:hypothetical protein